MLTSDGEKKLKVKQREMEKDRSSRKWTSDETNLFCEILADPENNFMETLEKTALKKHPTVKYLITLLLNLKKACQHKGKNSKNLIAESIQVSGQSRSGSLKILVIWNQKYNDNPFLN